MLRHFWIFEFLKIVNNWFFEFLIFDFWKIRILLALSNVQKFKNQKINNWKIFKNWFLNKIHFWFLIFENICNLEDPNPRDEVCIARRLRSTANPRAGCKRRSNAAAEGRCIGLSFAGAWSSISRPDEIRVAKRDPMQRPKAAALERVLLRPPRRLGQSPAARLGLSAQTISTKGVATRESEL